MQSNLLKQSIDKPYRTVQRGQGIYLFDSEGRDFIDGSSGAMTANIGHGVAEIAEVMREQAAKLAFTFRTQFTNEPAEALAHRIARLAPGDLNWVFFVNSGSEASEYAIRTAVQFWHKRGRPRKVRVLGRTIGYHGMTLGAVSMSGQPLRRADYGSLTTPLNVMAPPYAYRDAPDGLNSAEYTAQCAAAFERELLDQDIDTVAGVIAEPIIGAAGGVLVPPPGYFERVREICDRHEVLLIFDEVITGLGRTGSWFVASDEAVVPDIVLTGKGTSAGFSPLAAVILRDHVVDVLRAGDGLAPFGHTFSANPLSTAVGLAVLDYIDKNALLENAREQGEHLRAGLLALSQRYKHMVDVRGRGLLWGFEFVVDRATKKAPDSTRNANGIFVELCFENGLLVYPAGIAPFNNSAMVAPPLVITREGVDSLLERLDGGLSAMERRIDTWN